MILDRLGFTNFSQMCIVALFQKKYKGYLELTIWTPTTELCYNKYSEIVRDYHNEVLFALVLKWP